MNKLQKIICIFASIINPLNQYEKNPINYYHARLVC